jgi:hypothetical protein
MSHPFLYANPYILLGGPPTGFRGVSVQCKDYCTHSHLTGGGKLSWYELNNVTVGARVRLWLPLCLSVMCSTSATLSASTLLVEKWEKPYSQVCGYVLRSNGEHCNRPSHSPLPTRLPNTGQMSRRPQWEDKSAGLRQYRH